MMRWAFCSRTVNVSRRYRREHVARRLLMLLPCQRGS